MRSESNAFPDATPGGRLIAPFIDHTLLKPDAAEKDVVRVCREARHYGFAAVCVNPFRLRLAASELKGSPAAPCTVVGFPLGAGLALTKAREAEAAVGQGAMELDMVMCIGALKDGDRAHVAGDIRAVVSAASGRLVKVILETHFLTDDEKRTACLLAVEAGAHFVKTSTGFLGGGATVADIRLMRRAVGPQFGVKASGGVRTAAEARAMLEAGANRIGTSAGVALATG
ncbi:MAG: deoxyribose-phosphate aldolase [Lentisphaerae bacterium]|nr:deoxyribose-phosphate aldolase [Lentisphaerota bacterium]